MASIYNSDYQEVIGLLKKARQDKGITQVQLAELLGKPQSFVAKFESGERRLDVVEFARIAKLLDVSALETLNKIFK
ncbi:MAG: helix-turn-helix domain-containing protein [Ewingella americana]|jgi:transcriptional regulator with XRE-family HTH domain|uniref:DNA-binding protein n=2 Tax=Ewingella americana TaxID=41202 RepID=A0A085G629_EWIA3|nr:helix-turn-helix transcriptional regulator [Ewingella americana]KAA8727811.1 helix-turn-helix transcriptional regulator [Ewingella americana]KFC79174.1 DNA-binding protein [Ewingella americana ATCC 33852]MCI1679345.1 helix-turn-helix domain-containing protein [Ewingella americana]MCI1854672.1 helix-turn-helix domain-containing protein [Ewingella americana]MCI1862045.1 helix-turn-helix domain-containing protein [Ewingella americana]